MIRDKIENERKNKIEVKVCIFSNVPIYILLFTFYSILLSYLFLFKCLKFFQKLPTVNKELAQKLQEMKGIAKYKVIFIFQHNFIYLILQILKILLQVYLEQSNLVILYGSVSVKFSGFSCNVQSFIKCEIMFFFSFFYKYFI